MNKIVNYTIWLILYKVVFIVGGAAYNETRAIMNNSIIS